MSSFASYVKKIIYSHPVELFICLLAIIGSILNQTDFYYDYRNETIRYGFPVIFLLIYSLNDFLKKRGLTTLYYLLPLGVIPGYIWSGYFTSGDSFYAVTCILVVLLYFIVNGTTDNKQFLQVFYRFLNSIVLTLFAVFIIMIILIGVLFMTHQTGIDLNIYFEYTFIYFFCFLVIPFTFLFFNTDGEQTPGTVKKLTVDPAVIIRYFMGLMTCLYIVFSVVYLVFAFITESDIDTFVLFILIFTPAILLMKGSHPFRDKSYGVLFHRYASLFPMPGIALYWLFLYQEYTLYDSYPSLSDTEWIFHFAACLILTAWVFLFLIESYARYWYVFTGAFILLFLLNYLPYTNVWSLSEHLDRTVARSNDQPTHSILPEKDYQYGSLGDFQDVDITGYNRVLALSHTNYAQRYEFEEWRDSVYFYKTYGDTIYADSSVNFLRRQLDAAGLTDTEGMNSIQNPEFLCFRQDTILVIFEHISFYRYPNGTFGLDRIRPYVYLAK